MTPTVGEIRDAAQMRGLMRQQAEATERVAAALERIAKLLEEETKIGGAIWAIRQQPED